MAVVVVAVRVVRKSIMVSSVVKERGKKKKKEPDSQPIGCRIGVSVGLLTIRVSYAPMGILPHFLHSDWWSRRIWYPVSVLRVVMPDHGTSLSYYGIIYITAIISFTCQYIRLLHSLLSIIASFLQLPEIYIYQISKIYYRKYVGLPLSRPFIGGRWVWTNENKYLWRNISWVLP